MPARAQADRTPPRTTGRKREGLAHSPYGTPGPRPGNAWGTPHKAPGQQPQGRDKRSRTARGNPATTKS
ncbi:hypothetical protein GCM10010252_12690 [Streptomyces aureoverticillatus]|nr:hypothetical protein GCM10010252_12690 [Streptomyces aureoverticillatus]